MTRIGLTKAIIRAACQEGDIRPELMISDWRGKKVIPWRMALAWVLHNRAGCSLVQCGRVLDRHHTTILHAIRTVDAALEREGWAGPTGKRVLAIWRLAQIIHAHQIDKLREGVAA